jgi:hypothetical protein
VTAARIHLADRAIGADGEKAPARPGIAVADGQVRRRLADVEQPKTAALGERGQERLVAQPLVEPGRDVHPRFERLRGIVDEVAAEPAAGAGDAEHQGAGARRGAFGHGETGEMEGERAIVVAEFADAILAAERGQAARRLDAHRVRAMAEIEEIRARDHARNLTSRSMRASIVSGPLAIICRYGASITLARVFRKSVASALGGRLVRYMAWMSKVSLGSSGRTERPGASDAWAVKLSTTVIPTP